jgi:hypothetical protein
LPLSREDQAYRKWVSEQDSHLDHCWHRPKYLNRIAPEVHLSTAGSGKTDMQMISKMNSKRNSEERLAWHWEPTRCGFKLNFWRDRTTKWNIRFQSNWASSLRASASSVLVWSWSGPRLSSTGPRLGLEWSSTGSRLRTSLSISASHDARYRARRRRPPPAYNNSDAQFRNVQNAVYIVGTSPHTLIGTVSAAGSSYTQALLSSQRQFRVTSIQVECCPTKCTLSLLQSNVNKLSKQRHWCRAQQ